MKPEAAQADRRESVRNSARDWFRAGWIDAEAFRIIEELYPDDRVRTGTVFRVLFFVLTFAAIMSLVGTIYLLADSWPATATCAIATGVACAAVTDHLLNRQKRRQAGIEAAFSLGAIVNAVLGIMVLLLELHALPERYLFLLLWLLLGLFTAFSAWFWGYWLYASASAFAFFSMTVALRGGRLLWIVLVAALYKTLIGIWESAKLPPSIRKSALAFLAVALVGFYAAGNIYLVDQGASEFLPGIGGWNREFLPRWLAIALIVLTPVAILLIGVVKRRRPFLNLGFFLALLSLGTLRMFFHAAPPWVVLSAAGVMLFIAAAVLGRYLASGIDGERYGFTANPLLTDTGRRGVAEIVASLAAATPGPASTTEKTSFDGGGGKFGGGGASGEF